MRLIKKILFILSPLIIYILGYLATRGEAIRKNVVSFENSAAARWLVILPNAAYMAVAVMITVYLQKTRYERHMQALLWVYTGVFLFLSAYGTLVFPPWNIPQVILINYIFLHMSLNKVAMTAVLYGIHAFLYSLPRRTMTPKP